MQVIQMKTKLKDKIETLEKEKNTLLEEVKQLKEIVELSEKARELENEVSKLRKEATTLKDKIPQEFLEEFGETTMFHEDNEPPTEEDIL